MDDFIDNVGPWIALALLGFVLALLGACFALMLYAGVFSVVHATTERQCLARGWRGAAVSFALERYCVAREDQTDVVKPLRHAEVR